MKFFSKTLLLSVLMFLCSGAFIHAQKKSFDGVKHIQLKNMGAITKGNDVTGYYMFYKLDKVDRKNNSYALDILDQNLEVVKSTKIVDSKYLALLEGAYNGDAIILKFYESKEKLLQHRMYGNDGTLIRKKEMELTNKEAQLLFGSVDLNEEASKFADLHAVGSRGFVDYKKVKNKKFGYQMKFYPDTKGERSWTKGSSTESKELEFANFLAANDEIVLSNVVKKKSLMTRDMDFYLLGNDAATGKKLFEKQVSDSKYEVSVINAYLEGENIRLIGLYYEKGAKEAKAPSLGIITMAMDKKGEISDKRTIAWTKAQKFLDINKSGKIKDMGHVYFHRFVKGEGGKIYGIAESYKKAASGAGIAIAALGGKASLVKMVVKDMLVFEFSPEFDLTNIEVFKKGKSDFGLPPGAGLASSQLLGLYIKALGGFDYQFTQEAEDGSYFIIGYTDYLRVKGEKNKTYFGAISNADGEYSKDEIDLKTKGARTRVFKAKDGHVLIVDYIKKEKRLDMRIEKINF